MTAAAYDIEFSEPSLRRCECCGGLTVRLARFVYRDGDAYAAYFATYSSKHPDGEVDMLISMGEWGEGALAEQRVAFYCRVRIDSEGYTAMLDDALRSPWSDFEDGRPLSREEALEHPYKEAAFELLDEAFEADPPLRGLLTRVRCSSLERPLEQTWRMPDAIFALDEEERESRAKTSRHFATFDEERFFVRCLLPVSVETYGVWSVGIWVEVSQAAHDAAWESWDVPEDYAKLDFEGTIANDGEDAQLPIPLGAKVRVHAPHPDRPPYIAGSSEPSITRLLTQTWPQEDFEALAVERGWL